MNFSISDINGLSEQFEIDNYALRAFSALLESSDLSTFTDSCYSKDSVHRAGMYRHGLSDIVEMYIERQERKLKELCLKVENNPEDLIKEARSIYKVFSKHCTDYNLEHGIKVVRGEITKITAMIKDGKDKDFPEAKDLKKDLLKLEKDLSKRLKDKELAN